MNHFLYKTVNTVNGKYYCGMHSTDNMEDGYLGSGTGIKRAIKKYGKAAFTRTILMTFDSREELIENEIALVNQKMVDDPQSYNNKLGGDGWGVGDSNPMRQRIGRQPMSPDTRKKISESLKGRTLSPEHINNLHGRPKRTFSPETRQKIGAAKKGRPWSEARRKAQEVRLCA